MRSMFAVHKTWLPRLPVWIRWIRRAGRVWVERARGGEYIFVLFVAAFIGLLGGLAAVAFDLVIHLFQNSFQGGLESGSAALREIPAWRRVAAPTAGGLLVGLVTTYLVAEARGHGVPEVIRAVVLAGGRIRGRVAIAKLFASAITIGSGGSAGREGPVIQIGAAIGSRIGQAMGMSRRRLRTLVACGAAAGIAATFNAPVAGALFSGEVILGEFGATQFSPIVISSVVATVVARAWRGNTPAFSPPACSLASAWELGPYTLLGLLCGLVSFAYIRLNDRMGRWFGRMPLSLVFRPALGGLLVGILALALPRVLGDGHGLANEAFAGQLSGGLLLALVAGKMLATGLTLGSGGSGGVFSPALAIGALLGAALGGTVAPLLGPRFGGVAAYALVGMGGLVAGSMLAPITAIVMVFEISANYSIILPVMLVSILSTVLAGRLGGNLSIYTLALAREGLRLFRGGSPELLRDHRVAPHLRPRFETIHPGESAATLLRRLLASDLSQFYVVDESARLLGTITPADARRVLLSSPALLEILLAEDVMRRDIPVVLADENLCDTLPRFTATRLLELPVLRAADDRRLRGVLAYADVLGIYQDEHLKADAAP